MDALLAAVADDLEDDTAGEPVLQGVARFYDDPVGFIDECVNWPAGKRLAAYQREVLGEIPVKKRVSVRGPHGLGKALLLSVSIPTPTGWSTIGELQPGDEIFDENGKACRVVGKSPVWLGDTYEVEFADGSVITTHGQHEWNAIDVYDRPKGVDDWRQHWAATKQVTTEHMHRTLRSPGGQLRWRVPTAAPLELPAADLPVDPYLFGYWLGDGASAAARITVHSQDWPALQGHLARAGYHHGVPYPHKARPETLAVTVSTVPVRKGRQPGSITSKLRTLGVLGAKHIPMAYKRASVAQRIELIRGLWDSDGYRQAGSCDEITLTCKPLADDVAEVLRSLGLVVRVRESDSKLNGRVVGRRWRIAARFDFNPYHLDRYDWQPTGRQASRHTQRTIVDIRKVADQPTQCIEVDSPSHLYLAGESMIPTHNSATSALAILWFALTREAAGRDWKCVTTAGAWRQLEKYLWPEIHKWARMLRWDAMGREPLNERTELLALTLKLRYGQAFAVASDNPELIEGAHADSVMYVFDESKAISADTFDAAEGAFSGAGEGSGNEAFALAMSTPGEPNGRFYDIHRRAAGLDDWWARHVTLEEAIAAGRVAREWAESRHLQWGDSAVYFNRVRGEFHSSDEDGVIPLGWIEAANERWRAWDEAGRPDIEGLRVVGVDVARTGADKTVLALRYGHHLTELRHTVKEDTMATTGRVKGVVDANPKMQAVVDVIGIGAGVVDRLREQRVQVEGFNASEGTNRKDRSHELGFVNCLTDDARVLPVGQLLRIYRSRYEGPLFEVEMASGDRFTATANHQVLTQRGWVPVQSLNVGDQLCHAAGREPASPVRPEVDDVPPMLGEVYRAADRLFGSERVQGGAVNFHGDAPVGEVDVVTINRELLGLRPSGWQHGQDLELLNLLVSAGLLPGDGALAHRDRVADGDARIGSSFPHDCVLAGPSSPLVEREAVVDQVVRFAHGAGRDAALSQHAVDNCLACLEGSREEVGGFPGQVPADDLGLVEHHGARHTLGLSRPPRRDARLLENAAHHVPVDAVPLGQCVDRVAGPVGGDDRVAVYLAGDRESDGGSTLSWLDAAFVEDPENGGPVSPEHLLERLHRLAADVPLDEVVRVVAKPGHAESFVYTLETETGAYRTASVVHRNCRSAAWWNLREILDPAAGVDVALPPDDLLTGDLTAPHWRVMSGGKIRVESKDDIRKRLGRSTDDGDSAVMAFWPSSSGWREAHGVVLCDYCDRPFLANLHPERCPHCRQPREEIAA